MRLEAVMPEQEPIQEQAASENETVTVRVQAAKRKPPTAAAPAASTQGKTLEKALPVLAQPTASKPQQPGTPYLMDGRSPASTYQAAILREVKEGTGDVLVVAAAGSSKTTVLVEALRLVIREHLAAAHEVQALAFNRHIAAELSERLRS